MFNIGLCLYIGTGTSCIYPLLGCKLNGWSFLATDVAIETVEYARNNVLINDLQEDIQGVVCLLAIIVEPNKARSQ